MTLAYNFDDIMKNARLVDLCSGDKARVNQIISMIAREKKKVKQVKTEAFAVFSNNYTTIKHLTNRNRMLRKETQDLKIQLSKLRDLINHAEGLHESTLSKYIQTDLNSHKTAKKMSIHNYSASLPPQEFYENNLFDLVDDLETT